MSYSNLIETWQSGVSTDLGVQKGWEGHIWTALVTTLTEPSADNTDWELADPLKVSAVSIVNVHDPRDYLKTRIQGITLIDTHVSRPPEVFLQGFTFIKFRNKPYLIKSFI